ncbi:oligogalacturonate-specific porin KdgM family protein [Kluyvera ascorbata]|uniref:oligogalacturonate-specific porin KdgM family protein n=1 Tax=Kluyvera ascorbata TaxID=51288 RepID=UPI002F4075EC
MKCFGETRTTITSRNGSLTIHLGIKKEWKPYVTFGDIGRSSKSTERQFRLRMGVVYTFK